MKDAKRPRTVQERAAYAGTFHPHLTRGTQRAQALVEQIASTDRLLATISRLPRPCTRAIEVCHQTWTHAQAARRKALARLMQGQEGDERP